MGEGWPCLSLVPQFQGKWSTSAWWITFRREDGAPFQIWVTTSEVRDSHFVIMSFALR